MGGGFGRNLNLEAFVGSNAIPVFGSSDGSVRIYKNCKNKSAVSRREQWSRRVDNVDEEGDGEQII